MNRLANLRIGARLGASFVFILLLLLGIFSFGLVAMIAYVIAGPDGTRRSALPPAAA